jgi:hypothetical protein
VTTGSCVRKDSCWLPDPAKGTSWSE